MKLIPESYKEFLNESEEMPETLEHGGLVYVRAGKSGGTWLYKIFFNGHQIGSGRFKKMKELDMFKDDYTISQQEYNKLKGEKEKDLPKAK